MNINGYDSNSISTLFSSLGNGKSSQGSMGLGGIDLSTYSMIRTGSYGKLLQSYYTKGLDDTGLGAKAEKSTSPAKDTAKTLTAVKSTSTNLVEAAKNLYGTGKDAAFSKKDGEYDKERIYHAAEGLVEAYNQAVSAAGKSNSASITSAGTALVDYAASQSRLLRQVGIRQDAESGKLTLDEEEFKQADLSAVTSIFKGNGSFAYGVGVKASMLLSKAEYEGSKSNTYGNSGCYTYNYSTGELYRTDI